MNNTFRKNERITSRLLIDHLFGSGESKSVTAFPLKAVYCIVPHHETDATVQILISVPKRHFKRAVKRNRVKRQIREGYRLHKNLLPDVGEGKQLLIAFIWLSDSLSTTAEVEQRIIKLLKKIHTNLNTPLDA